jgi:hypothetical protein
VLVFAVDGDEFAKVLDAEVGESGRVLVAVP